MYLNQFNNGAEEENFKGYQIFNINQLEKKLKFK